MINPNDDYKPQKILLCTWIVELKLNEINKMKMKTEGDDVDPRTIANQKLFLAETQKDFWNFVDNNFNHKNEIDQILQNHGQSEDCIQSPKGKF